MGGTKVLGVAVAVGAPGDVIAEFELPTGRGRDAVVAAIDHVVEALRRAAAPSLGLVGVGLGLPGLVDRAGVLRYAANLPGVRDVDLAGELSARWGVPVAVDNDGNCAGRAEHRIGAGRGASDVVFLGLGTGVSTALVVGGTVVRGVHGFAGEAGHLPVLRGGPRCACGRYGCLEAIASGEALGRLARDDARRGRAPALTAAAGGDPGAVRGVHVSAAAARGDGDAERIVARFAADVAVGVRAVVSLLDPEVVVLGGSVVHALPTLVGEVGAALAATADDDSAARARTRLAAATLGRRAGAIGAALLVTLPTPAGTGSSAPGGGD